MNVHILEKSPSRYVLNEKGVSKLTLLLPYFCKFLLYPQQENQKIKTKLKPKKKKKPTKNTTNKQAKQDVLIFQKKSEEEITKASVRPHKVSLKIHYKAEYL